MIFDFLPREHTITKPSFVIYAILIMEDKTYTKNLIIGLLNIITSMFLSNRVFFSSKDMIVLPKRHFGIS